MGFAERNCLWSYQHQNTECANFQVCRPMQGKPHPLFMMAKPEAAVEEAFHENKHKQKSKDLEIQSLNFVLPCMCDPGKSFHVPVVASCKGFLEKGFVHIFLVWMQLFLLFCPVMSILRSKCAFVLHPGMETLNTTSHHLFVWEKKYLVKSSQKTAVIFYIWSRSSATSVASVTNCICSRRYLVTESQGLIKQYIYISCSEFYKYIETKM